MILKTLSQRKSQRDNALRARAGGHTAEGHTAAQFIAAGMSQFNAADPRYGTAHSNGVCNRCHGNDATVLRRERSHSFRWHAVAAGVALLCLTLTAIAAGRNRGGEPAAKSSWVPISDGVLKQLGREDRKIGYPGGTAGVSVDRTTGEVYMIVPDQGVWKSLDQAATFTRVDDGKLGGRCETGFALNADPAGRRLACFMLDGTATLMSGSGRVWNVLAPNGRGWDYGTVDWSQAEPKTLLAVHHESGEELYLSTDSGASWKLLGKDYTAVGIFNSKTFVASKGAGILRSTDGGATWTQVSDRTPTGRTLCIFKGVGYWVSREGLLVSKDQGVTWKLQGSAMEAAWGPFFGKNERQIAVGGRVGSEAGFWETKDAGATWKLAAPFPEFDKVGPPDWAPSKQWAAGWFTNFGWDPIGNIFYASRMGHPTLKYAGH